MSAGRFWRPILGSVFERGSFFGGWGGVCLRLEPGSWAIGVIGCGCFVFVFMLSLLRIEAYTTRLGACVLRVDLECLNCKLFKASRPNLKRTECFLMRFEE